VKNLNKKKIEEGKALMRVKITATGAALEALYYLQKLDPRAEPLIVTPKEDLTHIFLTKGRDYKVYHLIGTKYQIENDHGFIDYYSPSLFTVASTMENFQKFFAKIKL
jgi:hypothetical protein